MIIVTGMHRSGTSCVTGMLAKAGFSLGNPAFLGKNMPQPDNPKGHFENIAALIINYDILKAAGGSWHRPPSRKDIENAGARFAEDIRKFSSSFDGDVLKDPRACLTMDCWIEYCVDLQGVILCLRNPLSVAESLGKRNGFSMKKGLILWCEYNLRILNAVENLPVAVVNYDRLTEDCNAEFSELMRQLSRPWSGTKDNDGAEGFFEKGLNHGSKRQEQWQSLPEPIIRLYWAVDRLRNRTRGFTASLAGAQPKFH